MNQIILASKSPRRIEMLKRYFNDINVISSNALEKVNQDDRPETTVMKIAFEKARWVFDNSEEQGLIIAADTIVYYDKIMGKPHDYNEGYSMLKSLSSKVHKVFTGICLIDIFSGKIIVDYEETAVEFNELSDEVIKNYLDTGEYRDKAGSYGIQGYGELLVKKINGCYNNVKGLPLTKLNNLLKEHFSIELL